MTGRLMIKQLFQDSFLKPREAAQEVIAFNLSYDAIFSLFLAMVCASTALMFTIDFILPQSAEAVEILGVPWKICVVIFVVTTAVAFGIAWIGEKLQGLGDFKSIMALMAWMQVLQFALQIISYLFLLTMPPVAAFFQLALIGWSFWIFITFIDVAHGFGNMIKATFVSLLGSMLGVLSLAMLTTLFFLGT